MSLTFGVEQVEHVGVSAQVLEQLIAACRFTRLVAFERTESSSTSARGPK